MRAPSENKLAFDRGGVAMVVGDANATHATNERKLSSPLAANIIRQAHMLMWFWYSSYTTNRSILTNKQPHFGDGGGGSGKKGDGSAADRSGLRSALVSAPSRSTHSPPCHRLSVPSARAGPQSHTLSGRPGCTVPRRRRAKERGKA